MFYYPQIVLRTAHTPVFTTTHRNTTKQTELSMCQGSRTDKTLGNTIYSAASRRKTSLVPLPIIQSRVFRPGLQWYRALNLRTRLWRRDSDARSPSSSAGDRLADWLAEPRASSPTTSRYPYLTSHSSLNLAN